MFFRKKIERVLDVKAIEERHAKEEKVPLEKHDLLAMLIAAGIVFLPVLLILIGIVYGIMWLFIR
ncbi:MAG: hypothetical protein PHU24_05900 [Sphaerochaetaceae bacterium]|nr:hypothetical protein [Sphaerochaetaceae bacterium]NLO61163.1 hypothetical protein [Spirochaetales bacterium]MDD2405968.1 hypothetical protein [Sphaerochaetaceae bacterium]MDD3669869.1 hypothetical protein [Sphaerochaetaceae bacterium]MDD4260150.1 hypothetical protein [Sphaerochaetaceae bacterium]